MSSAVHLSEAAEQLLPWRVQLEQLSWQVSFRCMFRACSWEKSEGLQLWKVLQLKALYSG